MTQFFTKLPNLGTNSFWGNVTLRSGGIFHKNRQLYRIHNVSGRTVTHNLRFGGKDEC